jgi:hypothetical protein
MTLVLLPEHSRPRAVAAPDDTSPTPQEIQAMCLEIQKGWTDKERRRRLGRPQSLVRILQCSAPSGL